MFGIPDLPSRLARVEDKITSTLGDDGALLGPATVRMAATGGKRLRPLLTVVCAATGEVFDERVVAAAAAVELAQVGSLVHDDILDDAPTRRGSPTINAVEGVNHAVLAGDYVLARSTELAATVSREAAGLLAATVRELCEGQVLELRDAYDPDRDIDAHLASIRGKTAALFECACRLGAHCAQLSSEATDALGRYGDAFGMAFQVLDDVLDLIGDADRLGKPTGADVSSGVYTLPVLTALRGPGGEALRDLLVRPVDLARVLEVVQSSGSIPAALSAMDQYTDRARRAVAHLDQTMVGAGLAAFPSLYTRWALESLMDRRLFQAAMAS